MRKKKYCLSILFLMVMLLLYLFPDLVAMAADQDTAAGLIDVQDAVSSGRELTDWLETHKYTGGRVCLADDITLEESYLFVPYPNGPEFIVEAGNYTIRISGDVEFWSDGHFIFRGTGGRQSIFYIKKGGSLLLDGVNVECPAEGSALWQEEGAGLILGDTFAKGKVSGKIHYAQKPFVLESENICVVVKEGESVHEILPEEINCRVSNQGQVLVNEPVAVSWELAGTEKQQEERVRFQLEGSFSEAESGMPPVCTVVYDDYPLTFTNAEAFVRSNAYYFQGSYTRPEGELPIAIAVSYSFDGEHWILGEEETVSDTGVGFCLFLPYDQWDTSKYSHIYIRLQGKKDGRGYVSNVLRYAADNLKTAEDIGGGRGGGTAIVDSPSLPEEKPDDKPALNDRQPAEQKPEDNSGQASQILWENSGTSNTREQPEQGVRPNRGEQSGERTDRQQLQESAPKDSDSVICTAASDNGQEENFETAGQSQNNNKPSSGGKTVPETETASLSGGERSPSPAGNESLPAAAGFVLLAVLAGAAVYRWSGTKR